MSVTLSVSVHELSERMFGLKPQLRAMEGGQREVRQPLEKATPGDEKNVVCVRRPNRQRSIGRAVKAAPRVGLKRSCPRLLQIHSAPRGNEAQIRA